MGIEAVKTNLISTEKVKLLEWLRKPEFQILKRVLSSEIALHEVKALEIFERSVRLPRVTPDGEVQLIKALEAEITLKKIEGMLQPDADLYTVVVSVVPPKLYARQENRDV